MYGINFIRRILKVPRNKKFTKVLNNSTLIGDLIVENMKLNKSKKYNL